MDSNRKKIRHPHTKENDLTNFPSNFLCSVVSKGENTMHKQNYKMNAKEKSEFSKKFQAGEISTIEYYAFKNQTGYGICRFCGKVVKYADRMMYKRMVKHKCPHGTWCRTGRTPPTGDNFPRKYKDCNECCDNFSKIWENRPQCGVKWRDNVKR